VEADRITNIACLLVVILIAFEFLQGQQACRTPETQLMSFEKR